MRALAGTAAAALAAVGIALLAFWIAGGARTSEALGPASTEARAAPAPGAQVEGPRPTPQDARAPSAAPAAVEAARAAAGPVEREPSAANDPVAPEPAPEGWPPPVAGDLAGVLLDEAGPWTAESVPSPASLLLDLVSVESPRVERRGAVELVRLEGDEVALRFRLTDVPRGEYELVLSSLDARAWAPRSIFVSPPNEGLVFTRLDAGRAPPLAFRVLDAGTLEPIEEHEARLIRVTTSLDNGTLLHTGPLALDAFPDGAPFEWSVQADGYAPAFGDERAFRLEGTGAEARRVAEVRLQRGWGTRFLALGGQGTKRPLGGVSLLLDGDLVGTTDTDGWLEVRRAERPGKVEARYLDWKLEHDPLRPWGGRPPERRGGITPVLMQP